MMYQTGSHTVPFSISVETKTVFIYASLPIICFLSVIIIMAFSFFPYKSYYDKLHIKNVPEVLRTTQHASNYKDKNL